jgi:hypothetical protein
MACGTYRRQERYIQSFGGKPEERRTLGKPRHRWKDYIEIYLEQEDGEAWTGLIWLRIGTGGVYL